jgi:hypothetical protein
MLAQEVWQGKQIRKWESQDAMGDNDLYLFSVSHTATLLLTGQPDLTSAGSVAVLPTIR